MNPARCVSTALVFVFAAACGDMSTTPAAPTPAASAPAPSAPVPPPVTGQIALAATRPASGATLMLHDCPVLNGAKGHNTGPAWCTDDVQLDFSVVVNRDVEEALLVLTFITGDGRECASAYSPPSPLAADRPALLSTSKVVFYGVDPDPAAPPNLGCETLPSVTSSLRVQLVDVSVSQRAPSILSGDFALIYTFAVPQ